MNGLTRSPSYLFCCCHTNRDMLGSTNVAGMVWSACRRIVRRGHISPFWLSIDYSIKRTMSHASPAYYCEIESEPLERYRPGGYHPVEIGDTFYSGRYRVLQKLGWGGYSTVWLVYDSKLFRLAALKVVVSEISEMSNEARILKLLSSIHAEHEGQRHLRKLIDHFFHDGPNGRHQCLVFGVDGVSVSTLVTRYGGGTRLPGRLAWELSKQVTLALDCLHSNGIAHGGENSLCPCRES